MVFGGKPPRIDSTGAEPLGDEVRWVGPSPAYVQKAERQIRILKFVFPAIFLVPTVAAYFVIGPERLGRALEDPKLRGDLLQFAVLFLGYVAVMPFLMRASVKGFRLGASRAGLHYELTRARAFGRTPSGRVPWRDVLYDGRWLVMGGKQLILQRPHGPSLFDLDELTRTILVHIPKANLLTPNQLQMRLAGRWIWLLLLILVAGFVWIGMANL